MTSLVFYCRNANVLPKIDYERLQAVYGTETFDRETAGGYVLLPGVVQSKATGEVCIAILKLDLQSSGEHCATDFLNHYAVSIRMNRKCRIRRTEMILNADGKGRKPLV